MLRTAHPKLQRQQCTYASPFQTSPYMHLHLLFICVLYNKPANAKKHDKPEFCQLLQQITEPEEADVGTFDTQPDETSAGSMGTL